MGNHRPRLGKRDPERLIGTLTGVHIVEAWLDQAFEGKPCKRGTGVTSWFEEANIYAGRTKLATRVALPEGKVAILMKHDTPANYAYTRNLIRHRASVTPAVGYHGFTDKRRAQLWEVPHLIEGYSPSNELYRIQHLHNVHHVLDTVYTPVVVNVRKMPPRHLRKHYEAISMRMGNAFTMLSYAATGQLRQSEKVYHRGKPFTYTSFETGDWVRDACHLLLETAWLEVLEYPKAFDIPVDFHMNVALAANNAAADRLEAEERYWHPAQVARRERAHARKLMLRLARED